MCSLKDKSQYLVRLGDDILQILRILWNLTEKSRFVKKFYLFSITVDNQVIDSFESWLEVHLENCILSFDAEDIPKVEVIDGLNALHAHADEAARQFSVTQELTGVKDIKEVLDLIVALWWVCSSIYP